MTSKVDKIKAFKEKSAKKKSGEIRRFGREAVDYAIRDLITSDESGPSEIFYGHLASRLKKIVIDENYRGKFFGIQTAAVGLDGNDVVLVVYSPFFDELPDKERVQVIKHELQHVAHRHLFRGGPDSGYHPRIANIAMDAVINQYNTLNDLRPDTYVDFKKIEGAKPHDSFENYYDLLVENGEDDSGGEDSGECPNCGGTGEDPDSNGDSGGSDGDEEKEGDGNSAGDGDEEADAGDEEEKNGGGSGDEDDGDGDGDSDGGGGGNGDEDDGDGDGDSDGGDGDNHNHDPNAKKPCPHCGGSGKKGGACSGGTDTKYGKIVDSHEFFGKADENTNPDLAEEGLKGKIRKAAESASKSCGDVSAEVRGILADINEPHKVNWRKVLRNWATEAYNREKYYSPMKEHKVFSDVYPSVSFRKLPKFSVYIDVSGSVSQEEFNTFMRELVGINKALKAALDVSQFDTRVHKTDKVRTKKDIPAIKREYAGGTSFDDILRHAKENKTRNIIIMTDGFAPTIDTRGFNVLWAFTPHHNDDHKGKKVVIED